MAESKRRAEAQALRERGAQGWRCGEELVPAVHHQQA